MEKARIEKDRVATEKRILTAVGELITENGFEKTGVNAVAARAGISKMLIYRYFGSMNGLFAAYIKQNDFWINFIPEIPSSEHLKDFIKQIFRKQISLLREDKIMKRLYRWELSESNSFTEELKRKREEKGIFLINVVSRLSGSPKKEIAAIATILSAAIGYLGLLEDFCPTYNEIELNKDEGWQQIIDSIDLLIDKWFD